MFLYLMQHSRLHILGGAFAVILFFLLSPTIAHACASVPAGGDYTVSSSCSFADTVDGVDNGNITVNAGRTLTVGEGQTIAWGPGKSLIVTGAILINSSGSLVQKRIWVHDADSDGYPSEGSTPFAQAGSPGSGYRNRTDVANYAKEDCSDTGSGSQYVFETKASMVVDIDQDGYKTSTGAASKCVGSAVVVSGRTYYNDTSNSFNWLTDSHKLSGTDSNDGNASVGSYAQGYYYGQGYYYSQGSYVPDKTCGYPNNPGVHNPAYQSCGQENIRVGYHGHIATGMQVECNSYCGGSGTIVCGAAATSSHPCRNLRFSDCKRHTNQNTQVNPPWGPVAVCKVGSHNSAYWVKCDCPG